MRPASARPRPYRLVLAALLTAASLVPAQAAVAAVRGLSLAAPMQQAELIPADPKSSSFGQYVDISGSTAAVSAPLCIHHINCPGAIFVFVRTGSTWTQQAELTPTGIQNNRSFGLNFALSGSTIVAGFEFANQSAGVVYVFGRTGSTWSQQAILTASDGVSGDLFGASVALSGNTLLVGATGHSFAAGASYVFTRTGGIWSQQAELSASDGVPGDGFGVQEAVSGTTAVVASGKAPAGAAYVFDETGGVWSQEAELTASDGAAGDGFGWAPSISGSTVLVNAPNKDTYTGASYVFTNSGGIWLQQAELTPTNGTGLTSFGYSADIVGSTIVVGAPFQNPKNQGVVYVFKDVGGIWSQTAVLTASDAADYDHLGEGVALNRSTLVAGAIGHGANGAAYIFTNV